jgi:hypothetical protein
VVMMRCWVVVGDVVGVGCSCGSSVEVQATMLVKTCMALLTSPGNVLLSPKCCVTTIPGRPSGTNTEPCALLLLLHGSGFA